jgi:hypothetical protein
MPRNIKETEEVEQIEDIEDTEDNDDNLEIKEDEPILKRRSNYVLTDKRKEQFAKAREIRQQNVQKRKEELEVKNKELLQQKAILEKRKENKFINKTKSQIKDLKADLYMSDEENRKKPKKKTVVYLEEDTTDTSDEEIIIKTKPKAKVSKPVVEAVKPLFKSPFAYI